jgi:hypothetical protein
MSVQRSVPADTTLVLLNVIVGNLSASRKFDDRRSLSLASLWVHECHPSGLRGTVGGWRSCPAPSTRDDTGVAYRGARVRRSGGARWPVACVRTHRTTANCPGSDRRGAVFCRGRGLLPRHRDEHQPTGIRVRTTGGMVAWGLPGPSGRRYSCCQLGVPAGVGAGHTVFSRSQTPRGSQPRKCLTDWRYSHSMASLRR